MRTHLIPFSTTLLLMLSLTVGADRSFADGCCCAHCGCRNAPVQKTCRLVCEQKKVTVTCWGCKEEDFCVPGPSRPGCKHIETVCDESADPKAPCSQPKKFAWTEWSASSCAKVYTKQKLMKKTVTKTVPSYKWVVETLCEQCQAGCAPVSVPVGTHVPPAPALEPDVKRLSAAPIPPQQAAETVR